MPVAERPPGDLVLPCPALPCPALPCPALPCPSLPCPTPPSLLLCCACSRSANTNLSASSCCALPCSETRAHQCARVCVEPGSCICICTIQPGNLERLLVWWSTLSAGCGCTCRQAEKVRVEVAEARRDIMAPLSAASMESYSRAYPYLVKLHMLQVTTLNCT